MKAQENALLIPLPEFSAQSRDELQRAIYDCCRDNISSSEDKGPTRLHGPIGKWDVSQVTNMTKIFHNLKYFNYSPSDWDVSRVTDMCRMFCRAITFNQDLSKWDVSRVTNMRAMFRDAESFNRDLCNWDVSRVTDMGEMFLDAQSFQQTLCNAAWVNSDALKVDMFTRSPGSISNRVCGAYMLW